MSSEDLEIYIKKWCNCSIKSEEWVSNMTIDHWHYIDQRFESFGAKEIIRGHQKKLFTEYLNLCVSFRKFQFNKLDENQRNDRITRINNYISEGKSDHLSDDDIYLQFKIEALNDNALVRTIRLIELKEYIPKYELNKKGTNLFSTEFYAYLLLGFKEILIEMKKFDHDIHIEEISNTEDPRYLKIHDFEEYKTLSDLFIDTETFDRCIKVLKQVSPPIISNDKKYLLSSRKKGAITAWIDVLDKEGFIFSENRELIAELINSYITGLDISGRALNRHTQASQDYKPLISKGLGID